MAPELVEEPPVLDWHRLDLRMLIVRPLNELLGLIPVLVGLVVLGGGDVWRIAMSGGVIVLVVLFGLLSWFTTRYRITDDQVELHTGLLVRKRLAVPRDRIRTVDLTAKLGHRLFGLSAIRVGTGQHEKAGENGGVTLDAVSSQEAERLRQLLLDRAPARTAAAVANGDAPAAPVSTPLAAFDPRWLRFAPLTLSGLVAVGGTFGVLMNYAQEFDLRPSAFGGLHAVVDRVMDAPIALTIAVLLGVVLVLAVVASLLVYVVQFWGYRLTREDDGTLRVRRGLLTTRSVSVDEDRLRGVEVQEPLLLRLGRGARATAVATGLGTKGESSLLLPPAPIAEAHRVASEVLLIEKSPTRTGLLRPPAGGAAAAGRPGGAAGAGAGGCARAGRAVVDVAGRARAGAVRGTDGVGPLPGAGARAHRPVPGGAQRIRGAGDGGAATERDHRVADLAVVLPAQGRVGDGVGDHGGR